MFGSAGSAGGGNEGAGNKAPVNDDLLDTLRMMYEDAPDELLEEAARCQDENEAFDMVARGLADTNPDPKTNMVDALERLRQLLPQLGKDEVRGVLAGFEDDCDRACAAVATASPRLIDAMVKNSWSFHEAQKADEEAKAQEMKRRREAAAEDDFDSMESWTDGPLKLTDTEARMLIFGKAAVGTLRRSSVPAQSVAAAVSQAQLAEMVNASCPGASEQRTTRYRSVVEAMAECYQSGLHTLGGSTSPVNSQVVPALRHIFTEMSSLSPTDSKRRSCLSRLVDAFQDCQAVQAREVLSLYADLTSQAETLETQLKFALLRDKDAALNLYITQHHEGCDLDHTKVKPHQQRPHLLSAYIFTIGDAYGLDEPQIVAAGQDRFLADAQREIGAVNVDNLVTILRQSMSVIEWLQSLVADINNQSPTAQRLIQRHCIFKWAQDNLKSELAHQVFYDADRSSEFADMEPKEPSTENWSQPFLSYRVLVNMLASMRIIKHSASWWVSQK